MATKLKSTDVVIVGMGWTGSLMANELAGSGLNIVALERGSNRPVESFFDPRSHDELRYSRDLELMQDLSRETCTFRNTSSQAALPMRRHGSFTIGEGVGGSGLHWGGVLWRWMPWDHQARTMVSDRYGRDAIPKDMYLQDWGVTYDELEPYYDRFEQMCGASGKAGNIRGSIQPGGNPFEGARSREYPLPPLKMSNAGLLFNDATTKLGLHPFPAPAANASESWTNPDGITYGQCRYCGFCENYGCEAGARASPNQTVMPLLAKRSNFELRTRARVLKVNLDAQKTRAVSVTYVDAAGREFEQPADIIVLAAYVLANVHLMLLSGIGKPFDPATGKGVVGRSYSYQIRSGATVFTDKSRPLNPFMGTGALQSTIDDYYPQTYDSGKHGFIGGGTIQCASGGARPIEYRPVPPGTPPWGTEWKRAVVDTYHHVLVLRNQSTGMAYRQNYLDLDPTHRDGFGRPMLRMTFNYQDNEFKLANHFADLCVKIGEAMGDAKVVRAAPSKTYSIVPYQSTHNTGGAIMGTDRETSAVNRYLQSWDIPNVFVLGACAFPQNAGKNPTGPVAATTLWAAQAIRSRYLKNAGPLA
jgi:gluconate 2-dehydrogenase alpha chain